MLNKMDIILCSTSPRRIELLKKLIPDFKIIKPLYEEHDLELDNPFDFPLIQSENKANSIKKLANPQDLIISCDTVVYLENSILGKPHDLDHAFNMLKMLSGQTHQVISGYTIIYKDKVIKKTVVTKVTFNELNDELIKNYIQNEKVLDKAGSYGIQDDSDYHLIKEINGSYYNVMGFPLEEIEKDLINLGAIKN